MLLGDMATYLAELHRLDEAVARAREAVDARSAHGTLWLQLDPLDQQAQRACACGRLREVALALGRTDVHTAGRPGRRQAAFLRPFMLASADVREVFAAGELKGLYSQGAAMGDVEVARLTLDDPVTANARAPSAARHSRDDRAAAPPAD